VQSIVLLAVGRKTNHIILAHNVANRLFKPFFFKLETAKNTIATDDDTRVRNYFINLFKRLSEGLNGVFRYANRNN
jgi:hypothetical protein